VLSLKSNRLGVNGGKVLVEGLKGNSVLKELNIADNELTDSGTDMSGIIALAAVIPDMRAMTKFDISSNDLPAEGGKALAAGLKGNQAITELNISDNRLGQNSVYGEDTSGVIAIANAIPDMGALLSLNLATNRLYASGTTPPPPRVRSWQRC
jgi:Ran GTPase-activating protein (RanGAP) involved in mRNA processing and transport